MNLFLISWCWFYCIICDMVECDRYADFKRSMGSFIKIDSFLANETSVYGVNGIIRNNAIFRNVSQKVPKWVKSETCPRPENVKEARYTNYGKVFNDELWLKQWYIHDCRASEADGPIYDLNVVPLYFKYRLTGQNVVVVVVDDGVEVDHPDLSFNYDARFGLNLVGDKPSYLNHDPSPIHSPKLNFSHGTRCAGEIAMQAGNGLCGVGIAPLVTLGAVRLLGPNTASKDERDAAALGFKQDQVDIYSNSWGPPDDGKTMENLGPQTRAAMKRGVTIGRKSKGVIYVFAGGNGKDEGDNCAMDGYVSSVYTIAVASANQLGLRSHYSERCASIMVTAYSGGGVPHVPFNVATTDINGTCTTDHTGTSAAGPLVAGILALVLERNPKLTWRCVQHLLVWTSEIAPLQNNKDTWRQNKAGIYFSNDFGAGLVNAERLVTTAGNFTPVPPMSSCITKLVTTSNKKMTVTSEKGLIVKFIGNGCYGQEGEVNFVEQVQLQVTLTHSRRGDLEIELTSPLGTKCVMLERRRKDDYYKHFTWNFNSVHFWGESAAGTWVARFLDRSRKIYQRGKLFLAQLVIHGTKEKPSHYDWTRSYFKFKLPD